MTAHSAPFSLPTECIGDVAPSFGTSSGYRNLFGDATPTELYTGFGSDSDGRIRNRRMARWLAVRFGRRYQWPDGSGENRRIPAGYTYLAQLVIHDTIQSLADLPDLERGTVWPRNERSGRLVLDTIYGKGPAADPLLYGACPAAPSGAGFLRIGGREDGGRPTRDLPRSPCPFSGKQPFSDVLIADARNDDNVIIAQLAVLFHLLHNIVYGELRRTDPQASDARAFALARKVVTRIYREIVFKDLLAKLLHPLVYQHYMANGANAFIDADDPRMPLEFSHAAARFGHFMIRAQYGLNAELRGRELSVTAVVRQTSGRQPWDMPLQPKWLIDWSTLFDRAGAATAMRSRRLGPEMAATLAANDLFRDHDPPAWRPNDSGGLAYRDLLRGCESNLRSIKSIVERLPAWVLDISPMIVSGNVDPRAVVAWLKSNPPSGPSAGDQEYINCLAEDIPLLLVVLIEAAETTYLSEDIEQGECLGSIGSTILAEFFFKEYWRSHALIEADGAAQAASTQVFGEDPPSSMAALITEISRRKNWGDVNPKFW